MKSILDRDIDLYEASLQTYQMKLFRAPSSGEAKLKSICVLHENVIFALKELKKILNEGGIKHD